MTYVLDASVAASWTLPDEADAYGDAALETLSAHGAVAPEFFIVEIANVLNSAIRRNRISEEDRDGSLNDLMDSNISYYSIDRDICWRTITKLAHNQMLSVYDAIYIHTAKQTGLPLATLDKKLARACSPVGVSLWKPTP
ncbi:MAG: type II toxin-antitoxin system VapC family toxin [Pseudomonadota bacterium]